MHPEMWDPCAGGGDLHPNISWISWELNQKPETQSPGNLPAVFGYLMPGWGFWIL